MIEEQNRKCSRVQLMAKREGDYTVYAFKNLDIDIEKDSFLMCTKCPSWNATEIEIGQEGFLSYHTVEAGKHQWYKHTSNEMLNYAYSATYFVDFVPITHIVTGNRVVSAQELIIT